MLNSLYEKAITKKGFFEEIDSESTIEAQLNYKWEDVPILESEDDFSIAAGDGSFNKKKFLSSNFCAVCAESLIYDGEMKQVEYSDIYEIPHISFLDEILSNYMSIFELKCGLKSLNEYDADYYLLDGSIFGDLQNPYPKSVKYPDLVKNNLDDSLVAEFEQRIISNTNEALSFENIKKNILVNPTLDVETPEKTQIETWEINLYLAAIEKLIILKNILENKKKIISISKSSSDRELFNWNIPDISFLDKYTNKQGLSIPINKKVSRDISVNFPVFNTFFNKLEFTIFYVRLDNNRNVLKVEVPYKASRKEILDISQKINQLAVQGYPYLLNKAHNDVVITDKNINELLKIAKIYETTNREML